MRISDWSSDVCSSDLGGAVRAFEVVNELEYGLTCSIWTRDLERAHRTAMAVDVGYVWINETSRHILGAPFGGMKQSGIGREECLGELLAFTQEKNIFIDRKSTSLNSSH